MMRLHAPALALSLLGLTACGAATPIAKSTAPPKARPTLPSWYQVELPRFGLSASFPEPPQEIFAPSESQGVRTTTRGFVLKQGKRSLTCALVQIHVKDRRKDTDVVDGYLHQRIPEITRRREVEDGELFGAEGEGSPEKGRKRLVKAVMAGNALLVATVDDDEKAFEEATARRFSDACRIEITWRVYADPKRGFTLSIPTLAFALTPKTAKDDVRVQSFYFGGRHDRAYLVVSAPLLGGDMTPDSRLDLVSGLMQEQGNRIVSETPLEIDGRRARDLLGEGDGRWTRWRYLVANDFVYGIALTATDRAALHDANSNHFFASFAWR